MWFWACAPDYTAVAARRQLEAYTWLDVGAVAPGSRSVSVAPIFSLGSAAVTVESVTVEGEGFRVDDFEGALSRWDPDGDEDTVELSVTFLPDAEGPWVASLLLRSDDNVRPERDASGAALWTTTLRGLGRPVCARRWPAYLDLGEGDPGTEHTGVVTVENCGVSTLVVAGAEGVALREPFPVYVLPGSSQQLTVVWQVASTEPWSAELRLVVDDDALADAPVTVVGNTEPQPDPDGDGWSEPAGDCDETRADVGPGAEELEDGRDNDCDGVIDEGTAAVDDDGDGLRELEDDPAQNDCDDVDPWVYPGAEEMCDDVDNDCDDEIDEDACPAPAEAPQAGDASGCAGVLPLLVFLPSGARRRASPRRRG